MGLESIFGKKNRKEQVRDNWAQGKRFEKANEILHRLAGDKVEKIPDSEGGADSKITRRGYPVLTREGKLVVRGRRTYLEEVKSSPKARLSKRQRKMKKKYGSRYKVVRPLL